MSQVEGQDPAEREAYLDRVLVGGREPVVITLVPYDPAWADRFEAERRRILGAVGDTALLVGHIGSTAVPGLAAKPIVDIVLTVPHLGLEPSFAPQLERAGYELRVREHDHLMFRTAARDVHVHVYGHGHGDVARYLALRDRLRADEPARRRYEQVKKELAARSWRDMNEYADAKTAVIEEILRHAQANLEAKG